MAILWAESMDKFASNDIITDQVGWAGNTINPGSITGSAGRFGGNAYTANPDLGDQLRIPLSGAGMSGSTLIIGMAVRFGSDEVNVQGHSNFLNVFTAATGGSRHVSLGLTAAGGFILTPAGTTTANSQYSGPSVVYFGVWHWLECKFSLLDAGSFEVKVDGATVFSGSADLRDGTGDTSTISHLRLGGIRDGGVGATAMRYSDIIIADGSGSAPWNDFFGDLRIESKVPDADGATAAWTPLSSTNVSNIDDALGAYDDDTTYISSATVDQINDSSHANHVLTDVTTIHFVQMSALIRNDGATNARVRIKSGATVSETADITLSTAYQWRNLLALVDPNTSAAWTLANINAAEFGVKAR